MPIMASKLERMVESNLELGNLPDSFLSSESLAIVLRAGSRSSGDYTRGEIEQRARRTYIYGGTGQ